MIFCPSSIAACRFALECRMLSPSGVLLKKIPCVEQALGNYTTKTCRVIYYPTPQFLFKTFIFTIKLNRTISYFIPSVKVKHVTRFNYRPFLKHIIVILSRKKFESFKLFLINLMRYFQQKLQKHKFV